MSDSTSTQPNSPSPLPPTTDEKQRITATNHLLNRVTWKGVSDYMTDLTQARTRQLCDAMTVPPDLMKGLLFMAGGRGSISAGGGGSNSELTN